MRALIFLRLMRITSCFQLRRKEYLVYGGGGLSFSSFSERYRAQSAHPNFFKPCPLISEKLALGCPLFSKRKQKAQRETMIWTTLRVKFKDKEYAAHKMASTGTYSSTRLYTVKEGGYRPPSPTPLGALQPLRPETESRLQFCGLQNTKIRFSSRSSNVCNFTPRIHQKRSQKVRNQNCSSGACPQTALAASRCAMEPPFSKF